jgi:hypothetical protein
MALRIQHHCPADGGVEIRTQRLSVQRQSLALNSLGGLPVIGDHAALESLHSHVGLSLGHRLASQQPEHGLKYRHAARLAARYRPDFYDKWGNPNWKDYPATLEEHRSYETRRDGINRQGIMGSFSAAGFNEVAAMIDAQKRFEALGLL